MATTMNSNVLMDDRELCQTLGISRKTLTRHLQDGPPRVASGSNVIDVRLIRRADVGSRRRWVRESVLAMIHGMDE